MQARNRAADTVSMRSACAWFQPPGPLAQVGQWPLQVGLDARRRRRALAMARLSSAGWAHHRQVDQVAAHDRVVAPAVGIGQQLARGHVQRRQRGHAAQASSAPAHRADAGLEHDLELDSAPSTCSIVRMPYWSARIRGSGSHLPRPGDGTDPARPSATGAGRGSPALRDQEIDVDRLAVLAVAQRHGGAAAEQAAVGCKQRPSSACSTPAMRRWCSPQTSRRPPPRPCHQLSSNARSCGAMRRCPMCRQLRSYRLRPRRAEFVAAVHCQARPSSCGSRPGAHAPAGWRGLVRACGSASSAQPHAAMAPQVSAHGHRRLAALYAVQCHPGHARSLGRSGGADAQLLAPLTDAGSQLG